MIWSFGRAVVWLKRSAKALERIAEADEQLARIAQQEFNIAHPSRREVKRAEFGVADVDADWNKRYAIEHPELIEED